MGREYDNPPIIEAVCEFRLPPDTQWDLTIPGLVFEEVRSGFPNREQRLVQKLEVSRAGQRIDQRMRTEERVVFLTEDRKTFIQLGPNLLAINQLKPYPIWEQFKSSIEKSFGALRNVVSLKSLERIGLRYINRIEIPETEPNLRDYLEFRPSLGKSLPNTIESLNLGCVFSFSDHRDSCRVQLTNAASDVPKTSCFILDIDYFLAQPKTIAVTEAMQWLENAHAKVEDLFEGCITDRLRAIFQEVE